VSIPLIKLKKFSEYKNLRVLVTGSTGFKGAWLCLWLKLLGAKVFGVSLPASKEDLLYKTLNLSKRISQTNFNINNFGKLNSLVKKINPDIIFHLAAQSVVSIGYYNPLETFSSNIIGSANILETTRLNKIKALVYVTSDKCYLNKEQKKSFKETDELGGFDNYSSSKAAAEIIFHSYFNSYFKQQSKLHIASVRAGNVIGGGDFKENRIIPDIVKSIINNSNLIIRNPQSYRPWQHVLDPLAGYLKLGILLFDKKIKNQTFPSWNFGPSERKVEVKKLTKDFLKIWGIRKKIILNKQKPFHESNYLSVNTSKARKELKWKPSLNFNDSLALTVQWYKDLLLKKDMVKKTSEQIDIFQQKLNI